MKPCTKCGRELERSAFYADKRRRDGLFPWCSECADGNVSEWRKNNPRAAAAIAKKYRDAHRLEQQAYLRNRRWGLSSEENDLILKQQDGKCAICKKAKGISKALSVDHDHSTMLIRGYLCTRCNVRLGWVESVGLSSIEDYLTDPPAPKAVGEKHAPSTREGGWSG